MKQTTLEEGRTIHPKSIATYTLVHTHVYCRYLAFHIKLHIVTSLSVTNMEVKVIIYLQARGNPTNNNVVLH